MVITLGKILQDVRSTYPGDIKEVESTELINWINETYIEIRDVFIVEGKAEQFAIEQKIESFLDYPPVPYLKYARLRKPILEYGKNDFFVIYAICRIAKELKDEAQSWNKGDKSYIGNNLYTAQSDISDLNTFNETFKPGDVRPYYPANDLKYKVGDVCYEDGVPYVATQTEVNNSTDLLSVRESWKRTYWKLSGNGFSDPEIIDFSVIDRKKAAIDSGSDVMSFVRDMVYVSNRIESAEISYVPSHVWVTESDGRFKIPDNSITKWRDFIHQKILKSKGRMPVIEDER